MWLLVFASLCLKYTLSQESCDAVPSYRDACNNSVDACVGRTSIQLRCLVNVDTARASVQWFNAQELNADGTVPFVEPDVDQLQVERISVSTAGYWWCTASSETSTMRRCPSVHALHLYPCNCGDVDFSVFRSVCTSRRLTCNSQQRVRCRSSEQALLCLSTTQLSISIALTSTEAPPTETANTFFSIKPKTDIIPPIQTGDIPGPQTRSGRGIVTTSHMLLHSSVTPTPDDGRDRGTRAMSGGWSTVQLLLHIVGPVVALIAVSVAVVLLSCVGCLRYRKKYKLRGRRQSNSRSCSMSAAWKEEHIYDTVVLAKPTARIPPTLRYTAQPGQPHSTSVAAEYEVPVTRHGADAKEMNGHSHQQKSSVNPVYLDLYKDKNNTESTGNSDTDNS